MATVDEVARAALGDLAVAEGNLLNAKRWVNDRYAEFAGTVRLRSLRRLGELTLPAVVTAGTVAVVEGSPTVTPDGTAAATLTIAMEGRYFQTDRVWYRIDSVNTVTGIITLEQPYAGDTSASATYRIVQRTARLIQGCRTIIAFFHDRWNREVVRKSLPWLDMNAPDRLYALGGPSMVADVGEDAVTHRRLVEFYPYSEQAEHIRYAYYAAPTPLDFDEELPSTIDADALKEGVLIDVMRWKMAKALDMGLVDVAAVWRNEYRAQETKWRATLGRLTRADTVIEDLAWVTRSLSGGMDGRRDIISAQDQVYARGRRP